MGRDTPHEPGESTEYECFNCGFTTVGRSHPGDCPECSNQMRNRGTPLE